MIKRNNLAVLKNPYQGKSKRILCVCSGGVLRSPTAAALLIRRGHNTRSCGSESYALIPLSKELVVWADIILCMEEEHFADVMNIANNLFLEEPRPAMYLLNISDNYDYMQTELVGLLEGKFDELLL